MDRCWQDTVDTLLTSSWCSITSRGTYLIPITIRRPRLFLPGDSDSTFAALTPFVIDALLQVRKWLWKSDEPVTRTRTFALAWIVVPIVFFSFSNSKLPGYILPVPPALALLVNSWRYG